MSFKEIEQTLQGIKEFEDSRGNKYEVENTGSGIHRISIKALDDDAYYTVGFYRFGARVTAKKMEEWDYDRF